MKKSSVVTSIRVASMKIMSSALNKLLVEILRIFRLCWFRESWTETHTNSSTTQSLLSISLSFGIDRESDNQCYLPN